MSAYDDAVAYLDAVCSDMRDIVDEMEGENAKLRELVGQYHSAMRCMLETGTWPTDPAYLEEQMRELGIEVE